MEENFEVERSHLVPINDLKEHMSGGEWCHCKPDVRHEEGGVLVIHWAYDGREFTEEEEKQEGNPLDFIFDAGYYGWEFEDSFLVIARHYGE
jgi:hypothetical protein